MTSLKSGFVHAPYINEAAVSQRGSHLEIGYGNSSTSTTGPNSDAYQDPIAAYTSFLGSPNIKLNVPTPHSVEMRTLLDAFTGSRDLLNQVMIDQITQEDQVWVTKILPWQKHEDSIEIRWSVWKFDSHMTDAVPHLSVPRLLTSKETAEARTMQRQGIAAIMEYDFHKTPKGRMAFFMHLAQIRFAIVETQSMGVVLELLRSNYVDTLITRSDFSIGHERYKRVALAQKDQFAILQVSKNGLIELFTAMKTILQERGVTGADVMILPEGGCRFLKNRPEHSMYFATGRPDPTTLLGEAMTDEKFKQIASRKLVQIVESRPFRGDEKSGNWDPFPRQTVIAGHEVMLATRTKLVPPMHYQSWMRKEKIYSQQVDQHVDIDIESALQNCLLFNEEDQDHHELSNMGREYFADYKNLDDYFKTYGYAEDVLDYISANDLLRYAFVGASTLSLQRSSRREDQNNAGAPERKEENEQQQLPAAIVVESGARPNLAASVSSAQAALLAAGRGAGDFVVGAVPLQPVDNPPRTDGTMRSRISRGKRDSQDTMDDFSNWISEFAARGTRQDQLFIADHKQQLFTAFKNCKDEVQLETLNEFIGTLMVAAEVVSYASQPSPDDDVEFDDGQSGVKLSDEAKKINHIVRNIPEHFPAQRSEDRVYPDIDRSSLANAKMSIKMKFWSDARRRPAPTVVNLINHATSIVGVAAAEAGVPETAQDELTELGKVYQSSTDFRRKLGQCQHLYGYLFFFCVKHNVKVALSFILFRLGKTFSTSPAILMVSGSATGNTYIGWNDCSGENDAQRKVFYLNYTFYAQAMVRQHKNIVRINNIFVHKYLGGNGHLMFDSFDQQAYVQDGLRGASNNKSIHVVAVPPDWTPNDQFIDCVGYHDVQVAGYQSTSADTAYHYPSAPLYAKFWNWHHQQNTDNADPMDRIKPRMATLSWQCFQLSFEYGGQGRGRHMLVTLNKGHFGPNAYMSGFDRICRGMASYLPPTKYSDQQEIAIGSE
jgi:hypothetical protein